MPTTVVNEICVYYERDGRGHPLLFLNGSGSTLESSKLLIDQFRSRFDVLAHDQRGLGRTDVPPEPYSMRDYASDALGPLDAVGWPRCRVVGVSFGAMVAQELAVTVPDASSASRSSAPRPVAMVGRRIRCTSSPISTSTPGPRWRHGCSTRGSTTRG